MAARSIGRFAFGGLIALAGSPAFADVMRDCLTDLRASVRLRACSEIIDNSAIVPDQKALAFVARGNARTDAGAVRQAIEDFNAALRLKKDSAAAFAARGRARFVDGNPPGALADYTQAIRFAPRDAGLYMDRGHVNNAIGKSDAAIADISRAIELNGTEARAFNERGVAYFNKHELERALADFTQAIALVPLPQFYLNRASTELALSRREDAMKDFRTALLGDPSLVEARKGLQNLNALDPAIRETEQRVMHGAALADQNCSPCHAIGTNGASPNQDAPEFRYINQRHPFYSLREPITKAVMASHEKMPDFKLNRDEVGAIVAYINNISVAK